MLAHNLVYSVQPSKNPMTCVGKRTLFAMHIEEKRWSRLVEEDIQVRVRRKRLDRMLKELIAINARDKAFLCVQDPEAAEVADWRIRQSRVTQILEEFQTLVVRASCEA
jgi:hypothetical protein